MSTVKRKTITGPYRATKLWNDAVRSFYNEMPLSRHWRGLKQYENCFTASEAVDWLHDYLRLNPNFGQKVTRDQTIKLLRKFVKSGLIVGVRGSKIYAEDFQDNRELFKFGSQSPLKILRTPGRTPLAPIIVNALSNNGSSPVLKGEKNQKPIMKSGTCNKGSSTCDPILENISNKQTENFESHAETRGLSDEETNKVWQETFFEKLENLSEQLMVGGNGSSPLLSTSSINATWIRHNMTLLKSKYISRAEGFVSSEDLPSWILSAMNSLVNWPHSSYSICNIPNYPGVEIDIFKVVREFFSEMIVPLIPFELYDTIVRMYIGAEFFDIAHRTPSSNKNSLQRKNNEDSFSSITSYDSVEDLILNISAGGNQFDNGTENAIGRKSSDYAEFCQEGIYEILKENQTYMTKVVTDGVSSVPTSLKFNQLKNYTNFKDSYLYSKEISTSKKVDKLEKFKGNVCSVSNKATIKSLKNKSPLEGKLKENDSLNSGFGFKKGLKTEELDNYCLPPNSCFETAFTSDSPRTRIIPQKSVDTIHFRQISDILRPRSIAVSSLSRQSLIADAEASQCISSLNKVTSYQSDLKDRSLSEGNLLRVGSEKDLVKFCTESKEGSQNVNEDYSFKKSLNPRSILAAKVRDSIKRKKAKNGTYKHKPNKITTQSQCCRKKNSAEVCRFSDCDCIKKPEPVDIVINRMRTKSGGYENPALSLNSFSPEPISSSSSLLDLDDLQKTSGGYINAHINSKSNLNHLDLENQQTESRSTQTSESDYSCNYLHFKRPALSSDFDDTSSSLQFPVVNRITSVTPDGCLSHSLSSTYSNSVYHSALSGFNHTPMSCNSALPLKSPKNLSGQSLSPPLLPKRQPTLQLNSSEFDSFRSLFNQENIYANCDRSSESPLSSTRPNYKSLSSSTNELSDGLVDRTPFGTVPPFFKGGLWRHYYSSPSKRLIAHQARMLRNASGKSTCVPGLLTKVGKEIFIEILQLLFLSLEPGIRRKLYLLLKMMNKVSNNERLQIDTSNTNRALMVKTFTRSILLSSKERDYDEMISTRIVAFMMDNFDPLFSPTENLAVLVHRKINAKSSMGSMQSNASLSRHHHSITYCHQISPETFEKQKLRGSQQFLSQLLDQILESKMNEKDKRKKLKEFKLLYPEIYNSKFPPTYEGKENQMGGVMKARKLKVLKKIASIKTLGKHKSFRI